MSILFYLIAFLFLIGLSDSVHKFFQVENIALNKPARQYSTYNDPFLWSASKAVDGCTLGEEPEVEGQRCCSVSYSSGTPDNATAGPDNFWEVYLGDVYNIARIVVYGRSGATPAGSNQLTGFKVYCVVGETKLEVYDNVVAALNGLPYPQDGKTDIFVMPMCTASVIRIDRPGGDFISLCEVEAYAACDDGYYGDNCTTRCGYCHDNTPCDTLFGQCPDGCQDGWLGSMCKEPCPNGTYGSNCSMTCGHCVHNDVCNITDGSCPSGCDVGYQGDTCHQVCVNSTYGFNCNETCGNCRNGSSCHVQTGNCPDGCEAGFHGPMCKTGCVSPMFGQDCSQECHCIQGLDCTPVEGACPMACSPGWQGPSCSIPCSDGYYGDDCIQTCGYCHGNVSCDKVSGQCTDGCLDGWQGDLCIERENVAFNQSASQTSDLGDQTADRAVDGRRDGGYCSSTQPTTQAEWSVTLDHGYSVGKIVVYGSPTTIGEVQLAGFDVYTFHKSTRFEILAYNNSGKPYNEGMFEIVVEPDRLVSEVTIRRTTDTNVSLTICEVEVYAVCPYGWFGDVCNVTCGHCLDNHKCHGISGRCMSGCEAGWQGDTCYTPCTDHGYGSNCDATCGHCVHGDVCNITDGSCPSGCDVGYQGDTCHEVCVNSTYGFNCNETCGNCRNGSSCDVQTGNCPDECEAGFQGSMCTTGCVSPMFGQNCSQECHCLDDNPCTAVDGACPMACSPGWEGSSCSKPCSDGYYGDDCIQTCGYCHGNVSCDNVFGRCQDGCLDGWQGDLCIERENVAFNQTASQTSDLGDMTAGRAVDGRRDGGQCSSTQPTTQAVWSVTLDHGYSVGKIVVYGSPTTIGEDQLAGFEVYTFHRSSRFEILAYNNSGKPYNVGKFEILVEPDRLVSEVTIKRTTDTNVSLTICEVEVYAVCPSGLYGDVCNVTCGHCLDNHKCHGSSGRCMSGCEAGWQGDTCYTPCTDHGSYGSNCDETCGHCVHGDVCNITDGSCPSGCDVGYQGDTCHEVCDNSTYGFNCNETCGNCRNGSACDVQTGNCPDGCEAGFQGPNCTIGCVSPNFGQDCLQECHCLDDDACTAVEGACPGSCSPGWEPPTCSIPCQNKTYGADCELDCGQCLNEDVCTVINGTCADGCTPGWLGDICSESCPSGTYGDNCSMACGNCKDGLACDIQTGACDGGCRPGWHGDMCTTECPDGSFGDECSMKCYCLDGVACNKTTGICPAGCYDGFTGEMCQLDLNRAKGQKALQSSTWTSGAGFYKHASLAVDGDFNQDGVSQLGATCSSTAENQTENPWWMVGMGGVTYIENITVYGPRGFPMQLQDFSMYLTNTTNMTDIGSPIYNSTGVAYGDGIYHIAPGMLAQYVYITLSEPGTLTLCEVRVFGDCIDGTFGTECKDMCHCADNEPCDKETGICPEGGCLPGWTTDQCNIACIDGMYGLECLETCGTCAANMTCDKTDGICSNGCGPGWTGTLCQIACDDGQYGDECNGTCGHCKDDAVCHKGTGKCLQGCAAGFHGTFCVDECTNGTYGEDCAQDCGRCVNDTTCDAVSGRCVMGCADGYTEPQCTLAQFQTANEDDENLPAILGGVFGALGLVLIVVISYLLYRRRQSKNDSKQKSMAYYPSMMTTDTTRQQQQKSYQAGYALNEGYISSEAYYEDITRM